MMENATGLVLLMEECPKNVPCTSMHMLFAGLKPLMFIQLLKFCYPVTCNPESVVMMSGAGRREVASVKESMPWLESQ